VLDTNLRIGGIRLVREAGENFVVVDDTVLKDLDETRAIVSVCGFKYAA